MVLLTAGLSACGAGSDGAADIAKTILEAAAKADYETINQHVTFDGEHAKEQVTGVKPAKPLTDINVSEANKTSDSTSTVPVSYKVDGAPVSAEWTMSKTDSGWTVPAQSVYSTVGLGNQIINDLLTHNEDDTTNLLFAGEDWSQAKMLVVPGVYDTMIDNKWNTATWDTTVDKNTSLDIKFSDLTAVKDAATNKILLDRVQAYAGTPVDEDLMETEMHDAGLVRGSSGEDEYYKHYSDYLHVFDEDNERQPQTGVSIEKVSDHPDEDGYFEVTLKGTMTDWGVASVGVVTSGQTGPSNYDDLLVLSRKGETGDGYDEYFKRYAYGIDEKISINVDGLTMLVSANNSRTQDSGDELIKWSDQSAKQLIDTLYVQPFNQALS